MTCNNLSVLPKELYREQRIDRTIEFFAITDKEEALNFLVELTKTFTNIKVPTPDELSSLLDANWDPDNGIRHSSLTQMLTDLIKELNEESA